ncbi:MAG: AAA family ATPase, partial [Myxococcota bacterium]
MRFPFENHPRFELVEELGDGLLGASFLVRDHGAPVVLSVLEIEAPQDLEAFRRSTAQLARLNHPGLDAHVEVFTEAGRVAMLRPFVHGETLTEYLRRPPQTKPDTDKSEEDVSQGEHPSHTGLEVLVSLNTLEFDLEEAEQERDGDEIASLISEVVRPKADDNEPAPFSLILERLTHVLTGILGALEHLHRFKHTHGALHPNNIIVDEGAQVHLTDFGVQGMIASPGVRDVSSREGWTATSGRFKSIRQRQLRAQMYVAPEVRASGQPSGAGDIYSLGMILYEALSGLSVHQIGVEERSPILSRQPKLPSGWADMITRMIAADPAHRPTPERLRELSRACTNQPAELPPTLTRAPSKLFGRQRVRRALVELAQGALTSAGLEPVLLEGPSGSGKRLVLEHVAYELAERGWVVLRTRCAPDEMVPLETFGKIARELTELLGRAGAGLSQRVRRHRQRAATLFPELRVDAQDTERYTNQTRARALGALRALCSEVSRDRPLLMILEDMHLASVDTMQIALSLQATEGPPVRGMMVGTSTLGARGFGPHTPGGASIPRLEVSLLGADMARALLGEMAPGLKAQVRGGEQYAPLLLKELAYEHTWRAEHGRAQEAQAEVTLASAHTEEQIEASYAELVHARLERLGQKGELLLATLAVAGGSIGVDVLALVGAQESDEGGKGPEHTTSEASLSVLSALRLARREAGVRGSIATYRIAHSLCRRTVLEWLGAKRASACATQLFEALAEVEGDTVSALRFAFGRHSGEVGDDALMKDAERALAWGEQRMAWGWAAHIGEWVLESGREEWSEEELASRAQALARLHAGSGRYARAAQLMGLCAQQESLGTQRSVAYTLDAAEQWYLAGETRQASEALRDALRYFGERYEEGTVSGALGRVKSRLGLGSRIWTKVVGELEHTAGPEDELRAKAYALSLRTRATLNEVRSPGFQRQLESLARGTRDRRITAWAALHHARMAMDHDAARAERTAGRAVADAAQLARAEEDWAGVARAMVASAMLSHQSGDFEGAMERLDDARAMVVRVVDEQPMVRADVLYAMGALARDMGDPGHAEACARRLLREHGRAHPARVMAYRLLMELGFLRGELEQVERGLEVLEGASESIAPSYVWLLGVLGRARLEIVRGRPEVAVGALEMEREGRKLQQLSRFPRHRLAWSIVMAQALCMLAAREQELGSARAERTMKQARGASAELKRWGAGQDAATAAAVHRVLARLALLEDRPRAALREVTAGIERVATLPSPLEAARCMEAHGWVLRHMEREEGAKFVGRRIPCQKAKQGLRLGIASFKVIQCEFQRR